MFTFMDSCHFNFVSELALNGKAQQTTSSKIFSSANLQQLCEQWIELSEELINYTFHEPRKPGEIER
jgi:hypothetical protein